jgi:hypothetical protein
VVNNLAGGLFDAQGDARVFHDLGSQPMFNNLGTFRKSGGTGMTSVDGIPFLHTNTGTVEVIGGTIAISGWPGL